MTEPQENTCIRRLTKPDPSWFATYAATTCKTQKYTASLQVYKAGRLCIGLCHFHDRDGWHLLVSGAMIACAAPGRLNPAEAGLAVLPARSASPVL